MAPGSASRRPGKAWQGGRRGRCAGGGAEPPGHSSPGRSDRAAAGYPAARARPGAALSPEPGRALPRAAGGQGKAGARCGARIRACRAPPKRRAGGRRSDRVDIRRDRAGRALTGLPAAEARERPPASRPAGGRDAPRAPGRRRPPASGRPRKTNAGREARRDAEVPHPREPVVAQHRARLDPPGNLAVSMPASRTALPAARTLSIPASPGR